MINTKRKLILLLLSSLMMIFMFALGANAETSLKKPSSLKAVSVTANSVKISWKKVSGAEGYEVYRAAKEDGEYKLVGTVKKEGKHSFTNKKLKTGKNYYYKVRAYKGETYSKFSAPIIAMALEPTANLYVYDNNGTLTLGWDEVADVDGYKIYKQIGDGEKELYYTYEGSSNVWFTDYYVWAWGEFTYSVTTYKVNDNGTFESKEITSNKVMVQEVAPTPVPVTPAPVTPEPEPVTPEPDPVTPAPQTSLRDIALQYVGSSVSSLYGAIGYPASSEYQAGCTGEEDYEEGFLYYDGFIVATVRSGGAETVASVW